MKSVGHPYLIGDHLLCDFRHTMLLLKIDSALTGQIWFPNRRSLEGRRKENVLIDWNVVELVK